MVRTDTTSVIVRRNVGKIAERIVANELEALGFRVTDLNKDGLSANADLLAAGKGKVWQVQVKGASNYPADQWWFNYGHCTQENIDKTDRMFNSRDSFYAADIVVLVAVKSLKEYQFIALHADDTEKAVQINLDRGFRKNTRKGTPRKPGRVWTYMEPSPKEHERPAEARRLIKNERTILLRGYNNWNALG